MSEKVYQIVKSLEDKVEELEEKVKNREKKVKDGEEKATSLEQQLVQKVLECDKLKKEKSKKSTIVENLDGLETAKGRHAAEALAKGVQAKKVQAKEVQAKEVRTKEFQAKEIQAKKVQAKESPITLGELLRRGMTPVASKSTSHKKGLFTPSLNVKTNYADPGHAKALAILAMRDQKKENRAVQRGEAPTKKEPTRKEAPSKKELTSKEAPTMRAKKGAFTL